MQHMKNGIMRARAAGSGFGKRLHKPAKMLSSTHLTLLIFVLLMAGLALLYIFPTSSAYVSSSPSGVWLLRDGQWAQVQGRLESMESKTAGFSLRLCASAGGCVSIYAPERINGLADAAELKTGQALRVWGETSSAQGGARFIRAHRIELLTESELNQFNFNQ